MRDQRPLWNDALLQRVVVKSFAEVRTAEVTPVSASGTTDFAPQ